MKLTSKNIAIKVLKAKGCLSDTVKRMREYIEEGDIEKANCARMNALKLASWIDALGRWRPTISAGYRTVAVYTGLSYDPPKWVMSTPSINGISFTNPIKAYVSIAEDVNDVVNCAIVSEDDIITAHLEIIDHDSATLTILSTAEVAQLPGLSSNIDVIELNVPFEGMEPYCLTNEETVSIVGKIDELCECNC